MLTKPGDVEDDARASQQVACIACRRVSQTFSPQVECIHEGEAGSSSFFFFFNLQQAGLRLSGHRHVRWMVCSHRSLFHHKLGYRKKFVQSVIGMQYTSDVDFFFSLPELSHIQITWCHFFFHMTKAVNTQSAL